MSATLVVYAALDRRLRESVADHLYSLRRYSRRPTIYLNLAVQRPPRWLRRAPLDLVVFHTTFLSKRGTPAYWERLVDRARPLKILDAVRVALPQDEYLPPARLCDFVEEFEIDHVFSVAPRSQWPAIYPTVSRGRATIHRALTGYVEPRTVRRIERTADGHARTIDIGYRAKNLPAWLGRHARLKTEIADAFAAAAPAHGLSCDISTRAEDTIVGVDWLRFLLSCRYTIGVEGGASVLDRDGSLRACCERVLAERPGATYHDIERECFPGRDGEFGLVALSPRHLEAVATRTCQVLIEGEYDGVLEPERHYIPLRRDLSNLDEVLERMRRDEDRERIVETAYRDVVASGTWSYPRFVERLEDVTVGGPPRDADPRAARLWSTWARVPEAVSWGVVAMRAQLATLATLAARVWRR